MSILIKGMEMPENCYQCPACDKENGKCQVLNDFIFYDRPDWCPLVPLPEGHGRLIDADALEREISDAIYNYWNGGDNGFYLAEDALPEIRFAPTIVPAEGGTDDG